MATHNLKRDLREEQVRKRRLKQAERAYERLLVARGDKPLVRVAAPTVRSAFLYVITDGRGEVKVGFSVDVDKRRANLQTARATTLTVYARECVDCLYPKEAEDMAHKLLERYRVRGEWFKCHPEVALAAIRKAAWLAEDGGS